MEKTKKILLSENEIPRKWYNVLAEMPNKPLPPLNPQNNEPLAPQDLNPLFSEELVKQETNMTDSWIEIPDEVREMYKIWRPTPLVRAYELEKALDTPAHIYFKNESVSPVGSHKLNSAIPQAYYAKKEGLKGLTTETGAGQWGTALSFAAQAFGLEALIYMVKLSFYQKPYRRSIMETFGGNVIASPSDTTNAGRNILETNPDYTGSLGTAISEAVESAMRKDGYKYALGSVLNHVSLHQTVIGLESELQMEKAGEYPDVIIGCFGGGSNFSGLAFPFLRHNLNGNKNSKLLAVEPKSSPKLTQGEFKYDFGDEAGYTPLIPMYTLGHKFVPAAIHAGGLRYHGAGAIVSQLKKDDLMDAVAIGQLETFEAAVLFAKSEGIIPAPESAHAIAAAIREAKKAKEEGLSKTILFNLSGHGLLDMTAYDQYFRNELKDYEFNLSKTEEVLV